jgi:hypothetical protein
MKHKAPAFQFYSNDWLSSATVNCMTLAQRGAYIQLLAHDWSNDGLPDDPARLAILSGGLDEWHKGTYDPVKACFLPYPGRTGFLTNPRLHRERQLQCERREICRQGGLKGARKRWEQEASAQNSSPHAPPINQPSLNHDSSSSSSSSSSDNNKKRENIPADGDQADGRNDNNNSRQKFVPPTIEEVRYHCVKIGLPERIAEQFVAFYAAKGWRIGKNPMRCWRSAMVTWRVRWENERQRELHRYRGPNI